MNFNLAYSRLSIQSQGGNLHFHVNKDLNTTLFVSLSSLDTSSELIISNISFTPTNLTAFNQGTSVGSGEWNFSSSTITISDATSPTVIVVNGDLVTFSNKSYVFPFMN